MGQNSLNSNKVNLNNNIEININNSINNKNKKKNTTINNNETHLNNTNNLTDLNDNIINPKIEKNNKNKTNDKKNIHEEVILIEEDDEEKSNNSHPYVKKIIENKSLEKKGKKSKIKTSIQKRDKNKGKTNNSNNKNKEIHSDIKNNENEKTNDMKIQKGQNKINTIKIENNNKVNNDNLSISSYNDKGNFNQVLFDYKNFNGNNGARKRKTDIEIDEEEKKEIKNQKDLFNKKKKKGWIQKEEIQKEDSNKDIKLESYINENIKENKESNISDVSLLSLGKINEEINEEENKIEKKKDTIVKIEKPEKKEEIIKKSEKKNNEKNIDKLNSLDDLLLLDKLVDNNVNSINSFNKLNSINNLNKISQETFDVDFNSNVQSKEKSYNFNNGLVLINNNNLNQKNKNENNLNTNNKINNIADNINKNTSKYQEYLNFKKFSKTKKNETKNNQIEENKYQNNININDYELEIKTQEDQPTYDDFYKMKQNNRKSVGNNKKNDMNILNIPQNSRIKKEREKMKGHKCELCQKFYDCINEDNFLCQECSRHRTDAPINKTPQGFYDLSL